MNADERRARGPRRSGLRAQASRDEGEGPVSCVLPS